MNIAYLLYRTNLPETPAPTKIQLVFHQFPKRLSLENKIRKHFRESADNYNLFIFFSYISFSL